MIVLLFFWFFLFCFCRRPSNLAAIPRMQNRLSYQRNWSIDRVRHDYFFFLLFYTFCNVPTMIMIPPSAACPSYHAHDYVIYYCFFFFSSARVCFRPVPRILLLLLHYYYVKNRTNGQILFSIFRFLYTFKYITLLSL